MEQACPAGVVAPGYGVACTANHVRVPLGVSVPRVAPSGVCSRVQPTNRRAPAPFPSLAYRLRPHRARPTATAGPGT
eukprot:scaffold1853_cov367-Prasinococcus_capsulatus_cf.AAC.5